MTETESTVVAFARIILDAALANIKDRSLIPAAEVTDWLLDIRQALGPVT